MVYAYALIPSDGLLVLIALRAPSTDPKDPAAMALKPFALSQYMRCPADRNNVRDQLITTIDSRGSTAIDSRGQ